MSETEGARFRLRGATVHYRDLAALDGIDLAVEAGERVALVGPSGSGKTTLLRLLNGTIRPSEGSVEVDGKDVAALSGHAIRRVRTRIGVVHQDFSLVPNLRVCQNVLAGRVGRGGLFSAIRNVFFPSRSRLVRVHEILERVGIPEKLFERTDRLSGGQQQRVAIARALYQDPEAILADEPVSNVDPARAHDTVALLSRIAREEGLTLVMSLHNLALAREFFPRLVGLRRGRVLFDRASGDCSEDEFERLYSLGREEMLADGA